MKRLFFIAVLTVALLQNHLPFSLYGQERGFTWGAMANSSLLFNNFVPVNLEVITGYNFNSDFSLALKAEENYSLFNESENSSHYTNTVLGIMAKYNFYKFGSGILDARAGSGVTVTQKDWQYWYGDIGIYIKAGHETTKPTLGIGTRYYKSFGTFKSDYWRVYLSIGFTFN